MHRTELTGNPKTVEAFKGEIAFHRRNLAVLWDQYQRMEAKIKSGPGNHADLERDKAFFIGVYKADIAKGVRVEQSKQAIAELEANYTKKHQERDAYENAKLARLQVLLKQELQHEQKRFEKMKKKNASLINDETLPLLVEAEQLFITAIQRADSINNTSTSMAAR